MTDKEKIEVLKKALSVYANLSNWRDVWKDAGKESETFKYFYRLSHRTKDQEAIGSEHHYYSGKAARQALKEIEK